MTPDTPTPERWRQIEQLYHAALERPLEEREAFFDEACAGDDELRREVVSLITSHNLAEAFISAPPDDLIAALVAEQQSGSMSGRTLGHYRLDSLLGAGGMGEVWRAGEARGLSRIGDPDGAAHHQTGRGDWHDLLLAGEILRGQG